MSHTLEELPLQAWQLPADEKARLVLHLPASLEPADSGDVLDAWRNEAEQRLDAVKSGTAETISADDVFAKLDRRLRS
ncbi:MAG: addiction module protein [Duganella sp.]